MAEYKCQPRAFKETLDFPQFIQMREEIRPCSKRMIRGNRFLLYTFDVSLKCAAETWVMKLEAFFLLHPVVEKEAMEISVLHLKGKASSWWFSHGSHAIVLTLADFTH